MMRSKINYSRKSNVSGFNIIGFILSLLFFLWSMFAFADMLWNFETNWVGYVWLGLSLGTFFSQIGFITARKASKRVFHEIMLNPNDSLQEIAYNTGVHLKTVKKVVVDLKLRGLLQNSFNTQTGQMENVHIISSLPKGSRNTVATALISQPSIQSYAEREEIDLPINLPRFCSYCGSTINPGATEYCEFCGQAV
ncbi:MAG: hypothetical protein ACFFE4_21270 [Candidatus Thorarchaeota archaeon]